MAQQGGSDGVAMGYFNFPVVGTNVQDDMQEAVAQGVATSPKNTDANAAADGDRGEEHKRQLRDGQEAGDRRSRDERKGSGASDSQATLGGDEDRTTAHPNYPPRKDSIADDISIDIFPDDKTFFGERQAVNINRAWEDMRLCRRRSTGLPLSTLSRRNTNPTTASPTRPRRSDSLHITMDVDALRREEEGDIPGPTDEGFDLAMYIRRLRAKRREVGEEPVQLGIVFKDLTVIGDVERKAHIQTVLSPLAKGFNVSYLSKSCGTAENGNIMLQDKDHFKLTPNPLTHHRTQLYAHLKTLAHHLHRQTPHRRTILDHITGYVPPGEMLLVLGRPSSGCSTLLRVLSGSSSQYHSTTGHISYSGIDALAEGHKFAAEVTYNMEDDVHFPTMTVRQTLRFAVECRAADRGPFGTRGELIEEMVALVVKMFGLERCADTVVGSATVRGISGGEKKRLSIAEQVVSGAAAGLWDGATRGLDASAALDFTKSLRILTDLLQKTTIVTLRQASEDMYQLFDKVMLLSEGKCIYFGPADQAKAHFEELGFECGKRITTPDFLTSVTDPKERKIRPGWENRIPKTTDDFVKAFNSSPTNHSTLSSLRTYEQTLHTHKTASLLRKRTAARRSDRKLISSAHTTTFFQQTWACMKREWDQVLGDKFSLVHRYAYNALMAIVVGTLFWKLPLDATGAFNRGGVLFYALLFNSLSAQGNIPKYVSGRSIVQKHKSWALYRPSAYYLGSMLVEIPFLALQILVFASLLYFMAGLNGTDRGTHYAFFMLVVFLTGLAYGALVRLLSTVSSSLEMANRLNGITLISLVLYAGYLIPPPSMKPWFGWIYWVDPLGYGLKTLLINEFSGQTFVCDPPSLVPYGPGYDNASSHGCFLQGATAGATSVEGAAYLQAAFEIDSSWKWINVAILIAFWAVYTLLAMFAMEKVEFEKGGYTTYAYKAKHSHTLPEIETTDSNGSTNEAQMDALELDSSTLTWKDVNYTVTAKGGKEVQLLEHVNGYVRPGQLTALMGSSGAGKTTLLDSLARRKTLGKLEGDVRVDGEVQGDGFKRISGYVEQMDVHNPESTVREALLFSARLRQPADIPEEQKRKDVERIIKLLELDDVADALIGTPAKGVGLSLEQRKRLTIGVELVARPRILFLDEPTSGLDAQASTTIVRVLRNLAEHGQAVLCTIHQPSANLFESFDRLLLLVRGGKVVYFGDLGDDSRTLIDYFERQGADKCPPSANPAEYILDAIGAGTTLTERAKKDWPKLWRESDEAKAVEREIDDLDNEESQNRHRDGGGTQMNETKEYAQSYYGQLRYVFARMIRSYWRLPEYNFGRVTFQIIIALIQGLTFFQLSNTSRDLQNRVFVIYQTAVLGILVVNMVQPQFITQRVWFQRETASGFYGWRPFAFSITTAEIPFAVVTATIFMPIFYYSAGLNPAPSRAFFFWLIYVIFNLFVVSFGQMIAAIAPTIGIAAMINPFLASTMALFSGVTIAYPSMPGFWKAWMYWIDPYHYYIEAVIANELSGLKVQCDQMELTTFEPTSGQTCIQYAQTFINNAGGYISNPDATSACQFCRYNVGDDYLSTLAWSYSHKWRNLGILLGFWLFNRVVIYFFVRRFKAKR
ncbi:hypothetical protein HDV00_012442 [Rhizophlyctis rosea]|nr:hypothetical protein HDV00_012442 [Rhizophlyctis rosea]